MLIDALASGLIRARVELMLAAPSSSENTEDLLVDDTLWDPPYYVCREYWLDYKQLFEIRKESSLEIPPKYICFKNGTNLIEVRPDLSHVPEFRTSPIFIADAEAAIGDMFYIKRIPSEKELNRYRYYDDRVKDEIIMVAWRYLAVNRCELNDKPHKQIRENISAYLQQHNLPEIDEKTSEPIITAVLTQFRSRELLESVLINSTGLPSLARRRKAARRRGTTSTRVSARAASPKTL